jgi:hypothetical protein
MVKATKSKSKIKATKSNFKAKLTVKAEAGLEGDIIVKWIELRDNPNDPSAMSVAVLGGVVYAARTTGDYRAVIHFFGDNKHGSYTTPTDGYNGTSIAAYNNKLYLAFRGLDSNQSLNVSELVINPTTMAVVNIINKQTSAQSTDGVPFLSATSGGLLVSWLGKGNRITSIGKVNV